MMSQKEEGSDRFDKLEKVLEMFIENSRHLSVLASDFPQGGQQILNQKLFTLVGGLQELGKSSASFNDVQIPLELLSYIDGNRNPQLFTRQCLENTQGGLQELGKSSASFNDVQIPLELLSYIDGNRNPQLFTRQCLENTQGRNAAVNGKIELYRKFRATLMKELSDEFASEVMQYRARRETKKDGVEP